MASPASPEAIALEFAKTHGLKAEDVMTTFVVTADPDTPLNEIAELMERHGVKRVPIVEGGQVVGVEHHRYQQSSGVGEHVEGDGDVPGDGRDWHQSADTAAGECKRFGRTAQIGEEGVDEPLTAYEPLEDPDRGEVQGVARLPVAGLGREPNRGRPWTARAWGRRTTRACRRSSRRPS